MLKTFPTFEISLLSIPISAEPEQTKHENLMRS